MSLVDDYLEREFGIKVSSKNDGLVTSVGTSAVRLFRHNPNRVMWMAINLSTNTIYAAFDPLPSATKGILLDPSGGIASSIIREDLHLTANEVWIIASGAASAIYAFEIIAVG